VPSKSAKAAHKAPDARHLVGAGVVQHHDVARRQGAAEGGAQARSSPGCWKRSEVHKAVPMLRGEAPAPGSRARAFALVNQALG
jgi:hypothetical protein